MTGGNDRRSPSPHGEPGGVSPRFSRRNSSVRITVNGQPREVTADLSVSQLLDQLQFDSRYVAVEVNRQLVPRAQHARHLLREGDQLEVVTLVGGG